MPDFSAPDTPNIPNSAPHALAYDLTHDADKDGTYGDRDNAAPERIAGAHVRMLRNELAALWSFVGTAGGIQVQDNQGGITIGYSAGRVLTGTGGPVDVSASTLGLTDDATNYVEVNGSGTVSKNVTGFTPGSFPLATVICSSADISSVTDDRTSFWMRNSDTVMPDNTATAWRLREAANAFITADTTDGDENLKFGHKVKLGSFGTPLDVTNVRKYGIEAHWSGNNYDVSGLRSRASLRTSDASTKTARGAELQAANADGIDAGVLLGALMEAIGKSSSTGATIGTMQAGVANTEWDAFDTITDLQTFLVRTHTRNNAGAGSVSGTSRLLTIENEAVGGNGQQMDSAIAVVGTNLSGGNKAFDYGFDLTGATYGTALMTLPDDDVIADNDATQAIANFVTAGYVKIVIGGDTIYLWGASNAPT